MKRLEEHVWTGDIMFVMEGWRLDCVLGIPMSGKGLFIYQLDCSPVCKPDPSYQVRLEAAMSTTALPNFIIIIIITRH